MAIKTVTSMSFADAFFRDALPSVLVALGITFSAQVYFGGLFLAMAGAIVARNMQPLQDKREWWTTLLTAWLAATIMSEIVHYYFEWFPVQLAMAAAGFGSRYLARMALAAFGMIQDRSDTIFDRLLDKFLPAVSKREDDEE